MMKLLKKFLSVDLIGFGVGEVDYDGEYFKWQVPMEVQR